MQLLRIDAQCFGIDHWLGDAQASVYGGQVYEELRAFHDPLYASFSNLLRSSFDDAVSRFGEGTIDLLHIDGIHTYKGVSHDFESWLPKMSSRGIVLLHDTNMRDRGFGVWQFFAEIAARYPTFEFLHSHGLGIAYVGYEALPAPLQAFFGSGTERETASIRNYFARLGLSVLDRYSLGQTQAAEQQHRVLKADVARFKGIEFDRYAARSMLHQQIRLVSRLQQEVLELSEKLARLNRRPAWFPARVTRALKGLAARLRSRRR